MSKTVDTMSPPTKRLSVNTTPTEFLIMVCGKMGKYCEEMESPRASVLVESCHPAPTGALCIREEIQMARMEKL